MEIAEKVRTKTSRVSSSTREVSRKSHIINCNKRPVRQLNFNIVRHTPGGLLRFSPNRILLYTAERQKELGVIEGLLLEADLADKKILNANVLDYLLKHYKIIPTEWKGYKIFFWGTIYEDQDGRRCVRYLYHNGHGWRSGYAPIVRNYWEKNDLVALKK